MKCAVCGKEIVGSVPILVRMDGRSYPLCSSLCHSRFDKEPARFSNRKRTRRSWFSRRKES
ncbi:MAG: TRASH domain-containing protein [bacterium]